MVAQHRSDSSRATLPRRAAITLSVLILLLGVAASAWAWLGGRGEVVELEVRPSSAAETTAAAAPPAQPGTVTVHVTGAIATPGVYELTLGARVDDALAAAGGLLAGARESAVNRAQVLLDSQQVYVPLEGEGAPGPQAAGGGPEPGLVNVNTAGTAELEELPGVGPTLAGRIIEHRTSRPFSSVEDLLDVPGIGPAILERIRTLVTV